MAPSWQFISSQTDKWVDNPSTRKIVREHAMRAFRRSQRLQQVKEYQDKLAAKDLMQDDWRLSFASPLVDSKAVAVRSSRTYSVSIPKSKEDAYVEDIPLDINLGQGLDPFSSTMLYNHHYAPQLFSHCTHGSNSFIPFHDIPVIAFHAMRRPPRHFCSLRNWVMS
jgi:hypothetical protein